MNKIIDVNINEEIIKKIVSILRLRGQTFSVAESCTGGMLSSLIVSQNHISSVYKGGIVCYSNFVKENILDVPSAMLKSHGAVSHPVVFTLAHEVRKKIKTNWGLAISGIAGPKSDEKNTPVGLGYFGISGAQCNLVKAKIFDGERNFVRESACNFILEEFLSILTSLMD